MQSGIYIHIPFCESKCGYCDFFSITDLSRITDFLSGLEKEIFMYADEMYANECFDTIYIGGGTPSVLTENQIIRILEILYKKYKITNNAEITIEVNPGTVNKTNLINLKSAGINRLSIGVQSFNNNELNFLNRIHNSEQSVEAFKYARDADFQNISIDLIYSLPNQTIETWKHSMRKAIELNPEHISAYNLTIEEGTPFYNLKKNGTLKPLSESKEKVFFNITDIFLNQAGYNHYEISNFTRGDENISRHNIKYWHNKYYLGFGPSAHSFWENRRWSNHKSVENYITELEKGKKPVNFIENLKDKDLEFELIFLSLRTYKGLNLKEYKSRTNMDFVGKYKSIYSQFIDKKLAKLETDYFRLTKEGMALYNEILPSFCEN